jgi:hypothetical protein
LPAICAAKPSSAWRALSLKVAELLSKARRPALLVAAGGRDATWLEAGADPAGALAAIVGGAGGGGGAAITAGAGGAGAGATATGGAGGTTGVIDVGAPTDELGTMPLMLGAGVGAGVGAAAAI